MNVLDIPLALIRPPTDPHRISVDPLAMDQLVSSITMFGLIHPITVTHEHDTYDIVAGHRRYLAFMRLGRTHIPAIVRAPALALDHQGVRFAENFDRSDLSPIEEAIAIAKEHFDHRTPLDTIAKITRRSTAWVSERIKLATIDDELAEHVHTRRLSIAAALALSHVEEKQHRNHLLRYTLDAGASLAVVKQWVNEWEQARDRGDITTATLPPSFVAGQAQTITMPCHTCHVPFDVYAMRIVRVCPQCAALIAHSDTQAVP